MVENLDEKREELDLDKGKEEVTIGEKRSDAIAAETILGGFQFLDYFSVEFHIYTFKVRTSYTDSPSSNEWRE